MATSIAIITLSALIAILLYKLVPLAIELGKLRNEQDTMIIPEIKALRRENDMLNRDIEKIMEGDEYVKGVWRDIIKSRRNGKQLFENFKNFINDK